MSETGRGFPATFAGILLVHATAFPFILIGSWMVVARLDLVLPTGPLPVVLAGVTVAGGLHFLLARLSLRSYGKARKLRGHLARCAPAYAAAAVGAWLVWTNRGSEGYGYVEPFLVAPILTAAGAVVADLLLLLRLGTGGERPR